MLGLVSLLVVSAPLAPPPQDCVAEVDAPVLGDDWTTWTEVSAPVALDGNRAAAGRHWTTSTGGVLWAGSVVLLRRGPSGWVFDQLLEAPAPCTGETFGYSLDLEGDLLVVGTGQGILVAGGGPPFCNHDGKAYVFDLSSGTPVHVQTLSGGASTGDFGYAVDLDGDVLVVGDPGDDAFASFAGRATVYRRVGGTFLRDGELAPAELDGQDRFGSDVAVSGDLLAAHAVGEEPYGATWIYRYSGGAWVFEQKLAAPSYAYYIDLDGGRLAQQVGNTFVGIFEHGAAGWAQTGTIPAASTKGTPTQSGLRSLDLTGDRVLVGGEFVYWNYGYAQVHEHGPSGWSLVTEFETDQPVEYNGYGVAVALNGPDVLVREIDQGAVNDAAHFLRLGTAAASAGAGLAGSGGIVPQLALTGCPVLGADLVLEVSSGLGGAPGLLAIGAPSAGLPAFGGTAWAWPWYATVPHVLGGAPGVPGAGTADLPLPVPPTLPAGFPIALQAGYLDPGAPGGVALSGALAAALD